MQTTNTVRLTDALERDLLAKAIDQQFRFRPLRSIGKLVTSTATFIAKARSQTNMRDMV
ncbi:MAG: hypothetical protein RLY91_104 [Pseudomonadota bacterium]|jgi:hypothetical protein